MTIPELQELTASEPLTLEEEYEMQGVSRFIVPVRIMLFTRSFTEKWRIDEDSKRKDLPPWMYSDDS
jgi:hypothetical protein